MVTVRSVTRAKQPKDQILQVDDTAVHLLTKGRGEPSLLLHGLGGPWGWLAFHDLMARHDHLIVPDHPGFGRSERPAWLETIQDMVFFYLRFLDTLNLNDVNLIGFSLEGWIAAELAVLWPHRIKRLILVDPLGLKVDGTPIPDIFYVDPATVRGLAVHQNPASDEADVLYPATVPLEEAEGRDCNQRTAALLTWRPYMHNPSLHVRLRRLANLPTLIVWGRHDGIVTMAHAESYHQAMPGSQLVALEESGHSPELEQPQELAQAVYEFTQGRQSS